MKTGSEKRVGRFVVFYLFVSAVTAISGLYLYNVIRWAHCPDLGFGTRTATGVKTVGLLLEAGRKAGLQVGDTIEKLNGEPFSTIEERRALTNWKIGESNTYTVERNGELHEITIRNVPFGFGTVFVKSGLPFLSGFLYVAIGFLVFMMKPFERVSWVFFFFAAIFGLFLEFLYPSAPLQPGWLETVTIFGYTFIPAVFLHLALCFPEERSFFKSHGYLQHIPYFLSLLLFVRIRTLTASMLDTPQPWITITVGYIAFGVLFFLGSCLLLRITSTSHLARVRARVVLLGFAIAASVPLLDFAINTLFGYYLVPTFTFYLPFFIIFPLAVGYSIIKHDLFGFDTIIKRTYGYVLTTGTIAGIYGLLVMVSNVAFGRFEITQSPLFPLVFVLAVVFFFNPVRSRVQKFIDRVFYRLEYDYRATVQAISESMRTLLGLNEIGKSIMDTALGVMFIDAGRVMLLDKEKRAYQCLTKAGEHEKKRKYEDVAKETGVSEEEPESVACSNPSEAELPADDPFVRKIMERKREVTLYDLEEDPLFAADRKPCKRAMERMEATLVVPLIYEDDLIGLIALGEKKSGKFYRREDINLLNILANQGAVAIENALMVEEVIEKQRMEEELNIARDLQMSMLPATCPDVPGLEIAAFSEAAREVGGDFFDFIEMESGKIGLVVGDVTGKSVSGALVMAASRSIFRMLSEQALPIGEIMDHANGRTKKDIKSGMFVALLYAVVDSKDNTVRLSSAGQTQPIHLSAGTGKARLLETEGDTFPLGILEESKYEETLLELAPEDTVVFYTDGVVEAMNPAQEIFGFERLIECIEEFPSESAEALLAKILDRVNAFVSGAEQHDDITVIVIKTSSTST